MKCLKVQFILVNQFIQTVHVNEQIHKSDSFIWLSVLYVDLVLEIRLFLLYLIWICMFRFDTII